jgi:hypothetical protein
VLAANSDGRLELFYTNLSNTLYHIWQNTPGGTWSAPKLLLTSGNAALDLKVIRNADGRLEVFTIGTDNRLYHTAQLATGGWSPEALLGSAATAKQLAVARNDDGRIEVFYTDLNNVLFHVWQTFRNSSNWSAHTLLQTSAQQAKQLAVMRRTQFLEVIYVGTDDYLYRNFQTAPGGGWNGEVRL